MSQTNGVNIVIPIGGTGSRFRAENYISPKPLVNVLGKSMIFHVLDSLKLNSDDMIFIIHHSELNKYDFHDLVKTRYRGVKIHFYELNRNTKGATDTVSVLL